MMHADQERAVKRQGRVESATCCYLGAMENRRSEGCNPHSQNRRRKQGPQVTACKMEVDPGQKPQMHHKI